MEVLEYLAYGRGLLLAIFLLGLIIYWFLKKDVNNIITRKIILQKNSLMIRLNTLIFPLY